MHDHFLFVDCLLTKSITCNPFFNFSFFLILSLQLWHCAVGDPDALGTIPRIRILRRISHRGVLSSQATAHSRWHQSETSPADWAMLAFEPCCAAAFLWGIPPALPHSHTLMHTSTHAHTKTCFQRVQSYNHTHTNTHAHTKRAYKFTHNHASSPSHGHFVHSWSTRAYFMHACTCLHSLLSSSSNLPLFFPVK